MLLSHTTPPPDGTCESAALQMFRAGFWAERAGEEHVEIRAPDGARYLIDTLFRRCSCQERGATPCIHLRGYCALLSEQRAYEEALEAEHSPEYDSWANSLAYDRTERLLREVGVCEF